MTTPAGCNFSHLSVKDLIEARDLFHAHLVSKRNVVATAIGRYLIRKKDIDKNGRFHHVSAGERRTLENSIVIDISWPCILVFVQNWESEEELVKAGASNIVPKTIYMPDGRTVPVCTVEATRSLVSDSTVNVDKLRFPNNLIGGGFPLLLHSQGSDRVASVGCVVTDGHKYYALTNKHVAGDPGEIIYSRFGADLQRIGVTSGRFIGKEPFSELYPGWIAKQTLVNCDAGLIELDDVNRWKTDIFNLPPFDELYDLSTINLDLDVIAERKFENGVEQTTRGKVLGQGAISGRIEGEILALFYRYKSVGGTEFVSDFLIAGRGGKDLNTHHGDSGTLLVFEDDIPGKSGEGTCLRPLALHWGQHDFINGAGGPKKMQSSYSLATSLTNICRQLDIDIVRGWNVDSSYTWGKVGHYTVAGFAIKAIRDPNLKQLLKANLENITFANDKITDGLDTKDNPDLPRDPNQGLCPLADVPDIIWKQGKKAPYGRQGDENPNHYADADAPSTGGKTLFEICAQESDLTVQVWNDYYDNIDIAKIGLDPSKPISKGLICFRVWQIFDYMITAIEKKSAEKFVFAAGVLAHYVGDGCQPLHSSYMSDGDPADNELIDYTAKRSSSKHQAGEVYKKIVNAGSGVHVAYEDHMIDDKIDKILSMIPGSAANQEQIAAINSGQGAGFAVLTLMRKTQETIHPKDIVEVFKASKNKTNVSNALFEQFGERTADVIARGSNYLAAIWDAAWQVGNGSNKLTNLSKVKPEKLIKLYTDPSELPSKHLDTIEELLRPPN